MVDSSGLAGCQAEVHKFVWRLVCEPQLLFGEAPGEKGCAFPLTTKWVFCLFFACAWALFWLL